MDLGQSVPRIELISLKDQTPVLLGTQGNTKQIVLFFTVECPHCQRELLNFEALFRRYNTRANFIAVSLSDSMKTQDVLLNSRFSFPITCDKKKKAKNEYRVTGFPTLFLIDERGILKRSRLGEASMDADEELILNFLNKKKEFAEQ